MPILPHRVQGLALGLCGCLLPRALGKAPRLSWHFPEKVGGCRTGEGRSGPLPQPDGDMTWFLTHPHPWPLQLLALLPFDDLKISGKPVVCSE